MLLGGNIMDVDPLCNRGQIHKGAVFILMCEAIPVNTLCSFPRNCIKRKIMNSNGLNSTSFATTGLL